MTALAVGQLVSEGRLRWTTPVKDILPDFQHTDPSVTNLTTVVDLLAHRTGLSGDISLTFQGDGDALLPADQLMPAFNHLKTVASFRNEWSYNSWGYAVAGRIIEKLAGQPFHQYLDENVYGPLHMQSTTSQPSFMANDSNIAEPYATLSNGTPVHLASGMIFNNTFFEAAAGAYSNINDMLRYSGALLDTYHVYHSPSSGDMAHPALKELDTILSGHIAVLAPSYRERSYGMGWVRTQLRGVLGVMGDNVDILDGPQNLPELGLGSPSKLCLYHQGSTAGYYSFIALFPETQSAVIVLVNSIALTDSPDTLGQAVTQALFDFKKPVDFVTLTRKTRDRLLDKYEEMAAMITRRRLPGTKRFKLEEYAGRYWNEVNNFLLDIRTYEEGTEADTLQISFQGLPSQKYSLRHLEDDTFEWVLSLDQEAKRGRYHDTNVDYFIIKFLNDGEKVTVLNWADYVFVKETL